MELGLLSAKEMKATRPSLEVQISDYRKKRPSSLPVIQNSEGNVKISTPPE
jgi:hypothetical protein